MDVRKRERNVPILPIYPLFFSRLHHRPFFIFIASGTHHSAAYTFNQNTRRRTLFRFAIPWQICKEPILKMEVEFRLICSML